MKKLIVMLMVSIFFGLPLCSIIFPAKGLAEDEIVYHGVFDFPVPPVMAENMSRYDDINNWIFFPDKVRWIDSNNDGVYDFIAIGLGCNTGYGAQIRYRLFYRPNSSSPEIGHWYWCAIQNRDGNRVFEIFNQ